MDIGERLTALENHIYLFAKSQFEVNSIQPTLGRLIMESVYSRFQEQAIAQMIAGQITVKGGERPEAKEKTGSVMELMKEFYGNARSEIEKGGAGGNGETDSETGGSLEG